MARLVPNSLPSARHSSAEKEVARRLASDLDDSHVVLHSVGLVRHPTKRWAEVDFVVVGPTGVHCLEVKGGRVGRSRGVWTFTDRFGRTDESVSGPFDQAGGAAGALQRHLAESQLRRIDGRRFQVGYGVVTPDVDLAVDGPDIDREILLDATTWLDPLHEYFRRLSDYWSERLSFSQLADAEVSSVVEQLRPDFKASLTRATGVKRAVAEIARQTSDQQRILDAAMLNPRLRVLGPAGSGKTFLATAAARQLAAEGMRTLLLCRTRALAEHLTVAAPEVRVRTITALQREVVLEAGRWDELPNASFTDLAERFLPALAVESADMPNQDAVVIDESQDFMTVEALGLIDRLLVGGLHDGTWHAYGDSNQALFGAASVEAAKMLETPRPAVFQLSANVRNSREITEWNSILSGIDETGTTEVRGPEVQLIRGTGETLDDLVQQALEKLDSFDLDDNQVVVLTHTVRDRDRLAGTIDRLTVDGSDGIRCTTAAAFKGLEATGVVMVAPIGLHRRDNRLAAYVAASRATAVLSIVVPPAGTASLDRSITDYAARRAAQ